MSDGDFHLLLRIYCVGFIRQKSAISFAGVIALANGAKSVLRLLVLTVMESADCFKIGRPVAERYLCTPGFTFKNAMAQGNGRLWQPERVFLSPAKNRA
ncbi:hypothetical protein [Serratia odorifera]|uniref:hypothetical protein n=1 Tax=Serratia odorifera TaxID=618 RepID=UPI000FDAEB58|nr:hypothetical protein [Serratia odorifera]MBJ2065776.1 hypothetical protein [Serratia odorifera]